MDNENQEARKKSMEETRTKKTSLCFRYYVFLTCFHGGTKNLGAGFLEEKEKAGSLRNRHSLSVYYFSEEKVKDIF